MKKRIVLYSIFIVILTLGIGMGVYGLLATTIYKNNNIIFTVNNEHAYFSVQGSYYAGNNPDALSTYNVKYTQEDYYKGANGTVEDWQIGASQFVYSETTPETNVTAFKYIIKIKNENSQRNLSVKLNNVAINQNAYFITDINYENGENPGYTIFSNDPENLVNYTLYYNSTVSPNKLSINTPVVVGVGDTLTVSITLTLNTKTNAFSLENNFGFTLDSVEI